MRISKNIKKVFAYTIILGVVYFFGWANRKIPETYVYYKDEIPSQFVEGLKSMDLLEDDEEIELFYSEGWSIQDKNYFVSDRHLVIHNESFEKPVRILSFDKILNLEIEYDDDDSFLGTSYLTIETDESFCTFPVSSEKHRDRAFYSYLKNKVRK